MSPNARPANLTPSVAWLLLSPIGRVSREPYWLGFMFVWTIILIAVRMWWTSLPPETEFAALAEAPFMESNALFPILFFALQWIELALVIKRCQDIGVSGFLALLIFVPFVNVIAVIVLGIIPGSPDANRHGPLPNSYFRRT